MKVLKTKQPNRSGKTTSSLQESEEEMARMNISIQKSLYKKIKQRALDEDKTVRDIVLESLKAYLRK